MLDSLVRASNSARQGFRNYVETMSYFRHNFFEYYALQKRHVAAGLCIFGGAGVFLFTLYFSGNTCGVQHHTKERWRHEALIRNRKRPIERNEFYDTPMERAADAANERG